MNISTTIKKRFCLSSKPRFVSKKLKSVKGFTLFEVLIAITIGSVLILVSTLSLRMGLSHLSGGEDWLNNTVKEATAFDFFWQQVSSIRSINIPKPKNLLESFDEINKKDEDKAKQNKVYFKGSTESMTFISPLSLKRHYGYGLIIATYGQKETYDGVNLVYSEKRLNPAILSSISDGLFEDADEEKKEIVIFENCEEITFEYLKGGEDPTVFTGEFPPDIGMGSVIQEWVGYIENKLPKAIKIVIKKEEEKERILMAPIMVTFSL